MRVLLQALLIIIALLPLAALRSNAKLMATGSGNPTWSRFSEGATSEEQWNQPSSCDTAGSDTLYAWTWEDTTRNDGWGDWWADNGIWEVGETIEGPDTTYFGHRRAGTNLSGN
jgi:hypothetical protein